MGVVCHAHTLLVVDQSPALTLLTNEGRCLHRMPLPKGKISHPRAVAVATDNSVYVTDDGGKIHLLQLCWRNN